MDLENDPWQRVVDRLYRSSDVWGSDDLTAAFPDGLEKVASAVVWTIGSDEIQWVETRFDLEAPKVEAAIFAGSRLVHAMLTGHGFGVEVRRLNVTALRATSTPHVHVGPNGDVLPFRFTADLDGFAIEFPWDPDNHKQDSEIHEQFQRLLALLV
jgi:hypothetical protein